MSKSVFIGLIILKVLTLGLLLIGGMVGALPVVLAWLFGLLLVGMLIVAVVRDGYNAQLALGSLLVMLLTVYFYGA
jgi:hypothetical protein